MLPTLVSAFNQAFHSGNLSIAHLEYKDESNIYPAFEWLSHCLLGSQVISTVGNQLCQKHRKDVRRNLEKTFSSPGGDT